MILTYCLSDIPEVLERRGDRPVTVHAEDEQVEDGGGGGDVIHSYPQLTHDNTKPPVFQHDVGCTDRHHQQAYHQVSYSQ